MKAEIINIGDEILIGQIVNTNATWMATQLNLIGVSVRYMVTISDDEEEILKAMHYASTRSEIVLITGGLGPTKDDVTKKTFASFFNSPLILNETVLKHVRSFFEKRNREINQVNIDQALVPEGCDVIPNENGTAPGMWMKKDKTIFVSLPGVPYEMIAMMNGYVLPRILKENNLPAIFHTSILTQGIGESFLAEKIEAWEDALTEKGIKLAYLPKPGLVRLRLSAAGKDQTVLEKKVNDEIETLKTLIPEYIFGFEEFGKETPTLEKIVSDLLREKKQTLSLAESCTGGYITSLITSIPGASEILKGTIVPYTNESKQNLLSVKPEIFTTVGAVSKECVEALAINVRKKFDSDYSIAVSGIAGPGGATDEKSVGLVWAAVASAEGVTSRKFQFGDNRQRNIEMAAVSVLSLLRKTLLG
jgi:nicotinamide-nucleotide amidase